MAVAAPATIVPISPTHHYKCQACGERMYSSAAFEEYQHVGCGGLVKLDPPPLPTALSDAKRFLDLHPWATTEIDNPVELLANLVAEVEGADDEDEEDEDEKPEGDAPARVERLISFVRKLRESCKISEQEFQSALALVAE